MAQMIQLALLGGRVTQDIAKIRCGVGRVLMEDYVYELLEGCLRSMQTEWENPVV